MEGQQDDLSVLAFRPGQTFDESDDAPSDVASRDFPKCFHQSHAIGTSRELFDVVERMLAAFDGFVFGQSIKKVRWRNMQSVGNHLQSA